MTNKKLIPERWVVHHDNAGTTVKENKKWMILKSNHIIKKYKKNIIKKIYNLKIKKRLIFLKL